MQQQRLKPNHQQATREISKKLKESSGFAISAGRQKHKSLIIMRMFNLLYIYIIIYSNKYV